MRVANGKSERRRVMWEGLTLAVHEGCEREEGEEEGDVGKRLTLAVHEGCEREE